MVVLVLEEMLFDMMKWLMNSENSTLEKIGKYVVFAPWQKEVVPELK